MYLEKELIFKKEKEGTKDIIGIICLTIFWSIMMFWLFKNTSLGIISILVGLSLIILVFKIKFNFEINENEVIFYRIFSDTRFETIKISQIYQVRFEDGFRTGSRGGNEERIYIYPKSKHKFKLSKRKAGYIPLKIGENTIKEIIHILRHFQNKNIDIKILTTRQEIKKQLNLKNWNEP